MINFKRSRTPVDAAINEALRSLDDHDVDSAQYGKILKRLEKLHKLQATHKPARVSPDTLAAIAANLIGIAIIVRHEHLNVITSKALGLLNKNKI